jgi:mono/diheme cytochrome c family protein
MNKIVFFVILLSIFLNANKINTTGDEVFRAYCWGCHHQTSMAFGPSFSQIANTRTKEQIITHIMAPKSDYKQLGYKRSVMPSFGDTLTKNDLELITKFILSYKGKN